MRVPWSKLGENYEVQFKGSIKVQEGLNYRGSMKVKKGSWSKFRENYEVQL